MIYKYHIYITSICISYIYKYMKFHCHNCAIQMPNNKVLLDYNHTHWFTFHLRLHFCDKDSVEWSQRLYGMRSLSCLLFGLLQNGSTVKNPSAMQETWVQCLGQEHPLEKEIATHSNILTRKSGEQRSLTGYSPWGHKRVGHDLATKQQQNKEKV